MEKSTADVTKLKPRPFKQLVDVGASDRAVRKFRQDLIPQRSRAPIAASAGDPSLHHSMSMSKLPPRALNSQHGTAARQSRDCFQCSDTSVCHGHKKKQPGRTKSNNNGDFDWQQRLSGSKYLGYGLGLLRKDHIVPSTDV